MKKHISLPAFLIFALTLMLLAVMVPALAEEEVTPEEIVVQESASPLDDFCDIEKGVSSGLNPCCINYDRSNDMIVTGQIEGVDSPEFYINLTTEVLRFPSDTSIAQWSVDGGVKWLTPSPRPHRFGGQFVKYLKRAKGGARIQVKFTNGVVVTFPKIHNPPKIKDFRLTPNYTVLADPTGDTPGRWTLTPRNGASNVPITDVEIIDQNLSSKQWKSGNINWGTFDESGLCIPLRADGVLDVSYKNHIISGKDRGEEFKNAFKGKSLKMFYRYPPQRFTNGEYRAASIPGKLTIKAAGFPGKFSGKTNVFTTSKKDGTYVKSGDGEPVLYSKPMGYVGLWKGANIPLEEGETYYFWCPAVHGAGDRGNKPASMKVVITP